MRVTENLKPEKVFAYFEEMCGIPHGSGNTKAISDYLVAFAKAHDLEYYQDELNDVIMIKEASEGYEDAEPIILQGHMDMVCEKDSDCDIDFEKEGLRLYVEDGFLKARGTTLGGDDGIAVAYALAILDDDSLKHPRLEVVVTVDEETGMDGAKGIDLSMLKGHILLNIDSETEDEFLTSCAGGTSVLAEIPVSRQNHSGLMVKVAVDGLAGGHSGAEIHKEHGNAVKLLGRVLQAAFEQTPLGIVSMSGGLKDNAIPRYAEATLIIPGNRGPIMKNVCESMTAVLKKEYSVSDPGVFVSCQEMGTQTASMLDFGSVNKVITYLRMVPDGVQYMSMQIPGLVEASLNFGIMMLNEDTLHVHHSIRSSVLTRRQEIVQRVEMMLAMMGAEMEIAGEYPAWEYCENSVLRPQIAKAYKEATGVEPGFTAIHAGLECGILSEKIPGLDAVSFGPNIIDIHTPKERLDIASTEKVYNFLIYFLEQAK